MMPCSPSRSNRLALVLAPFAAGALHAQSTVLYASNFEGGDGGFAPVTGEWEHGVPTAGPGGAHSGTQCWATNLDGPPSAAPIPHLLMSPLIDATAAAGADAILVSWWQYIDELPLVFPFPNYSAYVFVSGTGFSQDLFGRKHSGDLVNPPHVGWRRVTALLGPEHAVPDLRLTFRWTGTNCDGYNIDDVMVLALDTTTVASDDFEAGPGGFSGNWQHGTPGGCPLPATAASGTMCWGTSLTFCSYGSDQLLLSPVFDISPYANREEVYVSWNRWAFLEYFGDGVQHEVSYDGGTTFELASGWHHGASGPLDGGFYQWASYGIALDPTLGTSVRIRWHLTSDASEFAYGMVLDDVAVRVPEEVLGSGNNPPGSLFVSGGSFGLGGSVELSVDDPGFSFSSGSLGFVAIALGPDPLLPAGTPIPGFGMSAPGATGDLLIDLASLVDIAGGTTWAPGAPAKIVLPVPATPSLAGSPVWFQGAMVQTAPVLRIGFTTGLYEVLGP